MAANLGIGLTLSVRVEALLRRGTAVALALEQFEQQGIWTASALSDVYPSRINEILGDAAPPSLHGVGNVSLLSLSGIGVVGSRDVDLDGMEVARDIAGAGVAAELSLISGAARGVDQHAMNAAFAAGGGVVGVLADSLVRTIAKPSTRQAIQSGQVCLVTPYSPSAPFSPGNAMGRNKIIYALADCVVVVRSDHGSGGTWAGATEAIKKRLSTVVSWTGSGSAEGNEALVDMGARRMSDVHMIGDLLNLPAPSAKTAKTPTTTDQLSLF